MHFTHSLDKTVAETAGKSGSLINLACFSMIITNTTFSHKNDKSEYILGQMECQDIEMV
jgi:hypothetical protein